MEKMAKAKTIHLPPEFLLWLEEMKGLRPATIRLYQFALGQLLKFCRVMQPDVAPSLSSVWNEAQCKNFFRMVAPKYAISTMPNFHNAFACARKYLFLADKDPRNSLKLQEGFLLMSRKAQRSKVKYLNTEKMKLQETSDTLGQFCRQFYQSQQHWDRFFALADQCRMGEGKYDAKLDREEIRFMNAMLIGAITACNFKRSSDLSSISFESSYKVVSETVVEFRRKYPDVSMRETNGRVDRTQIVPAVLIVEESSKKGAGDHVVLINPRDVLGMKMYGKYVRPNGPNRPTTDRFFINSAGGKLSRDVSDYMRMISGFAEIPDLSITRLRRLAETENLLESSDEDVPNHSRLAQDVSSATAHMGHSKDMAEKSYKIHDPRSAVRASNRLLYLLERAGAIGVSLFLP